MKRSFSFRAVLFDLDGTLCDSLADIGDAVNFVLSRRGFATHSSDAYRRMIGEGVELLIRRALPPSAQDLVAEVVEEYRHRYVEHFADKTVPYPGIPELLDALTERKVPIAVLSNKRDDFTAACMKALFARWPFAVVRGERPGVPRKPDPAAALEIAEKLDVPPAQVAFVGDTRIDMQTACAAGMWAVGVTWGFRDRAELVAHGARAVIEAPHELMGL
ncbi:MAG: HAD family hydrolase [Myxococcota bacterium]